MNPSCWTCTFWDGEPPKGKTPGLSGSPEGYRKCANKAQGAPTGTWRRETDWCSEHRRLEK